MHSWVFIAASLLTAPTENYPSIQQQENINKSSYIHRKSYKNIDESQKHFEQQQQKSQTLKIV